MEHRRIMWRQLYLHRQSVSKLPASLNRLYTKSHNLLKHAVAKASRCLCGTSLLRAHPALLPQLHHTLRSPGCNTKQSRCLWQPPDLGAVTASLITSLLSPTACSLQPFPRCWQRFGARMVCFTWLCSRFCEGALLPG